VISIVGAIYFLGFASSHLENKGIFNTHGIPFNAYKASNESNY
jgi:hypothetical protein